MSTSNTIHYFISNPEPSPLAVMLDSRDSHRAQLSRYNEPIQEEDHDEVNPAQSDYIGIKEAGGLCLMDVLKGAVGCIHIEALKLSSIHVTQ